MADVVTTRQSRVSDSPSRVHAHAPRVEHLDVGVLVQRPDGHPLYVNAAGAGLLARTRSRSGDGIPFGRDWHLLQDDGAPLTISQRPLGRAIESRAPVSPMLVYVGQTPEATALLVAAEPMLSSAGQVEAVTTLFWDISGVGLPGIERIPTPQLPGTARTLHAIIVVDPEGRLCSLNHGARDLFAELLGIELKRDQRLADQLPESVGRELNPRIERALVGLSESAEFSVRGPLGEKKWIAAEFSPLSTSSRRWVVVALIALDDATAARDRSESHRSALSQRLLESMETRVAIVDGEGREVATNSAWRKLTRAHASVEEPADLFHSIATIASSALNGSLRADVENVLHGVRPTLYVDIAPTDLHGAPHRALRVNRLAGRGLPLFLVAIDDLGQHRVDAERGSEPPPSSPGALCECVLDSLEQAIVLLAADLSIVDANMAARALTGGARLNGTRLGTMSGAPWDSLAATVRESQRTEQRVVRELRDATTGRTWEVVAAPMRDTGASGVSIVGIARDVTAFTEVARIAAEGETLAAMGALVAGVAHEVRNPLFGISSTLDAFEATFAESTPSSGQPFVNALRQEVDRLTSLMSDLLDYGRPSLLTRAPLALLQPIQAAVAACEALAHEAGVRLVAPTMLSSATVVGDHKRLVQVFVHIFENAIQHAPARTSVDIDLDEVCEAGTRWVRCTVSDYGPGFRAEELQHAFEPFFTRRAGGTGLGLALVQRILYEHGGRATIGTRAEGGASVTVRLPARDR